jgi:hypothetical protein
MSQTLNIRIQDDLASWLEKSAQRMGVSQEKLVRQELERARQGDTGRQRFMRLAGSVRLDRKLSTRKGFSKS